MLFFEDAVAKVVLYVAFGTAFAGNKRNVNKVRVGLLELPNLFGIGELSAVAHALHHHHLLARIDAGLQHGHMRRNTGPG